MQIAQEIFGLGDLTKPQLTAFIATIQIGTELAVVSYFAKSIIEILRSWFKNGLRPWSKQEPNSRLGWLVIIGTVPIVTLGLIFQDAIETELRQLWIIGVMLIVFGLLLGFADRIGFKTKQLGELNLRSGLAFGFGQALALIPGVSRSGGVDNCRSDALALPEKLRHGTAFYLQYRRCWVQGLISFWEAIRTCQRTYWQQQLPQQS